MNYENGFYIYTPRSDSNYLGGLSVPQVIEIIESEVWVTGMDETFDIDFVHSVGTIGKMLMSQEGQLK
tara:strand:- start:438 stop:641 length:204 start_codon:yes stop_codon:yes gene_type:complete